MSELGIKRSQSIEMNNAKNVASGLNRSRKIKQTDYQLDEYERYSDIKMGQREKVLGFLLKNIDIHPRYFGMPGKYWMFERMLFNEDPKSYIVGIEKDYKIFSLACGYMPGTRFQRRQIYPWAIDKRLEGQHCKRVATQAIEIAETWANNGGSYYMCGDLLSMTDKKTIEKAWERGPYKSKLKNRNAIWYDFTSSFNVETYTAIYNIKNIISDDAAICLTLMYGRDQIFNGSGEAARVEIVEKALPGFNCLDTWIYKGFKNTPMITICGKLEKEAQK